MFRTHVEIRAVPNILGSTFYCVIVLYLYLFDFHHTIRLGSIVCLYVTFSLTAGLNWLGTFTLFSGRVSCINSSTESSFSPQK